MRIIKDAQTRRSKGIAYVEFEKQESVPMAVAKSGQIICGFPCVIQASQAEKNIAAKQAALGVSCLPPCGSACYIFNACTTWHRNKKFVVYMSDSDCS